MAGIYTEPTLLCDNMSPLRLIGATGNPNDVVLRGTALDNIIARRGNVMVSSIRVESTSGQGFFLLADDGGIMTITNCALHSTHSTTMDIGSARGSMVRVMTTQFSGTSRLYIAGAWFGGLIVAAVGNTIMNSMTVPDLLVAGELGEIALDVNSLQLASGTITGRRWNVHTLGRIANSARVPATTIAGATHAGGAVQ
jgi:hypothetical protein